MSTPPESPGSLWMTAVAAVLFLLACEWLDSRQLHLQGQAQLQGRSRGRGEAAGEEEAGSGLRN